MDKILSLTSLEILYKIGIPVQTFTLYHLIALFLFPIFFLFKRIKFSPISSLIIIFYLYTLIVTVINFQIYTINSEKLNFYPVFRQVGGLTIGIITFFVLRSTFEKNPFKSLGFVKYALFIILLFVLINDIILNDRFFRLCGSFTEPSHLGQYLVFILLPSILLLSNVSSKKKNIMIGLVLLLIFLTFSLSTYIRLFLFLLFFFLMGNFKEKLKYFMYSILILFIFIIMFLTIFKDSYVVIQFTKNLELLNYLSWKYATASLIDRIQFLFIIKNFFNLGLNTLWGIGLGFEKFYMHLLYPPEVLDVILNIKQVESYINSFWGKILLYSGLIGWITFVLTLLNTARILTKTLDVQKKRIILATLLSTYIYAFFGIAAFQTIELWFWIAFIDACYIYMRKYQ